MHNIIKNENINRENADHGLLNYHKLDRSCIAPSCPARKCCSRNLIDCCLQGGRVVWCCKQCNFVHDAVHILNYHKRERERDVENSTNPKRSQQFCNSKNLAVDNSWRMSFLWCTWFLWKGRQLGKWAGAPQMQSGLDKPGGKHEDKLQDAQYMLRLNSTLS